MVQREEGKRGERNGRKQCVDIITGTGQLKVPTIVVTTINMCLISLL